MCKAIEDMKNQTLKEGMLDIAKRMLKLEKYSLEEIADISGLSMEEITELQKYI